MNVGTEQRGRDELEVYKRVADDGSANTNAAERRGEREADRNIAISGSTGASAERGDWNETHKRGKEKEGYTLNSIKT